MIAMPASYNWEPILEHNYDAKCSWDEYIKLIAVPRQRGGAREVMASVDCSVPCWIKHKEDYWIFTREAGLDIESILEENINTLELKQGNYMDLFILRERLYDRVSNAARNATTHRLVGAGNGGGRSKRARGHRKGGHSSSGGWPIPLSSLFDTWDKYEEQRKQYAGKKERYAGGSYMTSKKRVEWLNNRLQSGCDYLAEFERALKRYGGTRSR
jgi:hypothetical protein